MAWALSFGTWYYNVCCVKATWKSYLGHMKYGNLILEKRDFVKLKKLLNFHRHYEDYAHKDVLDRLKERVDAALILDEAEMPDDVVRLNTKVTVADRNGDKRTFFLVGPAERHQRQGTTSVLSSLGASVIGMAQGDSTRMGVPPDFRYVLLVQVKQAQTLMPGNQADTEW
jgi:regulator of nucleoside diphosphate kinase